MSGDVREINEYDMSGLAQLMLLWEEKMRELMKIGERINRAVLERGKTVTVGNVRASFYKGRRKFDYQTPGASAPAQVIEAHSTTQKSIDWEGLALKFEPTEIDIAMFTDTDVSVDWKAVCSEAGIDPAVIEQGDPSVKLAVMG
jgi:hypothetical protein